MWILSRNLEFFAITPPFSYLGIFFVNKNLVWLWFPLYHQLKVTQKTYERFITENTLWIRHNEILNRKFWYSYTLTKHLNTYPDSTSDTDTPRNVLNEIRYAEGVDDPETDVIRFPNLEKYVLFSREPNRDKRKKISKLFLQCTISFG